MGPERGRVERLVAAHGHQEDGCPDPSGALRGPPDQRIAETPEMVDVGEPAPTFQDLIEQMDRPVVILDGKPLVGLLQEMFGTDLHIRTRSRSSLGPSGNAPTDRG